MARESLLRQRTAALLRGALAGGAAPEMLALTGLVARHGGIRRLPPGWSQEARLPFPAILELAVPVGIARRPQDHNGIVDDAVTLLAPSGPSHVATAGACAVAAALAALLDGWGMEGACDLALFVGRRGETFGRRTARTDAVARIRTALDAVQDARGFDAALRIASLNPGADEDIVPIALGLAWTCRSAPAALRAAGRLAPHRRVVAALAGALCGADNPLSMPPPGGGKLSDKIDAVVDGMLAIRTSWRRR